MTMISLGRTLLAATLLACGGTAWAQVVNSQHEAIGEGLNQTLGFNATDKSVPLVNQVARSTGSGDTLTASSVQPGIIKLSALTAANGSGRLYAKTIGTWGDTLTLTTQGGGTAFLQLNFQFDFDAGYMGTPYSGSGSSWFLAFNKTVNVNQSNNMGLISFGTYSFTYNEVLTSAVFSEQRNVNNQISGDGGSTDWTQPVARTGSLLVPILSGQSFNLGVSMQCLSEVYLAGTASCDASRSAYWGGIRVLDAQGNALNGWNLSSASGVNYVSSLVPGSPPIGGVPEPASWAMLIAGFGLVGAMQRRRKLVVAA
jgi:hypothetical protein